MKKIPLTHGKFALVDDEDYDLVSQYKWFFNNYAFTSQIKGKAIVSMHRLILGDPMVTNGLLVDHRNHDRIDNQRNNIRFCTKNQNSQNRRTPKNNISGYKGVYYNKDRRKWRADVWIDGKTFHIGSYETKEDAIKARTEYSQKLYKEFYCKD